MRYAQENRRRLISVRTLSNAVCAAPGITPNDLSGQTDLPIPETMRALELLLRNNLIVWTGSSVASVTPLHADAATQLQAIISVTGLDVDRPL